MKICVYAICKNEEKFVDRFMDSTIGADAVYVLDTGSTDKSVELLRKRGAIVKEEKIEPFRFDKARNLTLLMIPEDYDICISLDLDEVLSKNFREEILKVWDSNTTRLRYDYIWSFDSDNNPLVRFYTDKIHSRKDYIWTHPVHEVLKCLKKEVIKTSDLIIEHHPDTTKSRGNYLNLLELSVLEDPNDDRNMHYLGREYMFHGLYNEAIDTLIKHLNLESSVWDAERCASMRFISRRYIELNRYDEALLWLNKAIKEASNLREPYVEMANLYYELGNYDEAINYLNKSLTIKRNLEIYINEPFCSDLYIYDVLSVCYYNIGDYKKSLEYVSKALDEKPNDERIKNNKNIIEKMILQ